jgi:tRNA (guanine37-N1)-methyltransferase
MEVRGRMDKPSLVLTYLQDQTLVASLDAMSLFRPPIVRSASAILDRSLFSKTIPISAARISNNKNISRYRGVLQKSKELLLLERLTNITQDPDPVLAAKGGKCMLLKPEVKHGGMHWFGV